MRLSVDFLFCLKCSLILRVLVLSAVIEFHISPVPQASFESGVFHFIFHELYFPVCCIFSEPQPCARRCVVAQRDSVYPFMILVNTSFVSVCESNDGVFQTAFLT